MGVLGMSLDDFCNLEPSEFDAVCKAYHGKYEANEHSAWERTRMLACITIQPHVKKKLKPSDLIQFPWEKKKKSIPVISKEEQIAKLKRRLNES